MQSFYNYYLFIFAVCVDYLIGNLYRFFLQILPDEGTRLYRLLNIPPPSVFAVHEFVIAELFPNVYRPCVLVLPKGQNCLTL